MGLIFKKSWEFLCFRLVLLHLVCYFRFLCQPSSYSLMLSHLRKIRFSQSTHLLMYLSLETLTSIERTGWLILVELIDLMNSVIYFLCETNLFRWLTFLLGSLTVTLIVLLSQIYLFLLTLAFVLQQPSLHCEILIMLLSQFPSTFFQTQKRMPLFIAQLMTSRLRNVLCDDIFKLCASVAAAEFLSGSRLELMYVSLIVNIMSSLTHLHGF